MHNYFDHCIRHCLFIPRPTVYYTLYVGICDPGHQYEDDKTPEGTRNRKQDSGTKHTCQCNKRPNRPQTWCGNEFNDSVLLTFLNGT